MRPFKSLTEQEILALAISLEEEDARIYADFAEGLKRDHPATAEQFALMRVDEDRHRSMLKRAIQEHSKNGDIAALLSEATFRDDVSHVTGVSIDVSSPFSYAVDVEASGATVYKLERVV